MRLIVIDGQGGKMGKSTIEQLKKQHPNLEIYVIGTNSITTSAILGAGADYGVTGENPATVNAGDPDIIIEPIGIVLADSLLEEIAPVIVTVVEASRASKILVPVNRYNHFVMGCGDARLGEYIRTACGKVDEMVKEIL